MSETACCSGMAPSFSSRFLTSECMHSITRKRRAASSKALGLGLGLGLGLVP